MTKVHELHPGLADFIASDEGQAVAPGELQSMIAMERWMREVAFKTGRNYTPSYSNWRAALIQTRLCEPARRRETAREKMRRKAREAFMQRSFDAGHQLTSAAGTLTLRITAVPNLRTADGRARALAEARAELRQAQAALDKLAAELATAESGYPVLSKERAG